jgi:hypothetical protein
MRHSYYLTEATYVEFMPIAMQNLREMELKSHDESSCISFQPDSAVRPYVKSVKVSN